MLEKEMGKLLTHTYNFMVHPFSKLETEETRIEETEETRTEETGTEETRTEETGSF